MSMLNEQQAKALINKIISYSKADEVSVTISGGRSGNIRYARNEVSTNGETDNLLFSVTSVFGKRSGTASGNELDDASLRQIVQQSEETARLAPENPEYMPMLGAQEYGKGINYSDKSAAIDPAFRVNAVADSIGACEKEKTTAAGFLQDNTSFLAVGNKNGMFGFNRFTSGEFSVTVRTADEKGSGFSASYFTDASRLNTKQATSIAIRKALASRETVEMKPEKYTVILEPQAAFDLVSLLAGAMDARNADEGRSFFGKRGVGNRIGDPLFSEKVTIYSDPFHPQNPSNPFAADGRPQQKRVWIENGVLKNLFYSRYWAEQKKKESIPQPTNFIMEGSDATLDDLIRSTDKGILVTRFYYIRLVDAQTLVQTGLTRDGTFYIENGKIKHAIKNFRFNESPAAMLSNLEAVGQSVRIENALMPSMKIRNFNFTSLSDAV